MLRELKVEKMNETLWQEILGMVVTDQAMRKSKEWNEDIDKQNTARMKEIIRQHGWPGRTLVGEEAAQGAWLLVQHADHDVEF